MRTRESKSHFVHDYAFYSELLTYAKFLYEEEITRSERFHGAMKTYLTFIGSTVAGVVAVVKWLGVAPAGKSLAGLTVAQITLAGTVVIALGLLATAFVFTILVIKVWRTERLCDPGALVYSAAVMTDRTELLQSMIADFLFAADRNRRVNARKAVLLSRASLIFRIALLFLMTAAVVYALT